MKNKNIRSIISTVIIIILAVVFQLTGGFVSNTDTDQNVKTTSSNTNDAQVTSSTSNYENTQITSLNENLEYSDKDNVAEYIYIYGHLPYNYITKSEAKDLGWESSNGNLDKVAPGKSIGGDRFGNYEGLLPDKNNRTYTECDIDFDGKYRNAKRIIFSNDGLIYYTDDHYESFELLYGDE